MMSGFNSTSYNLGLCGSSWAQIHPQYIVRHCKGRYDGQSVPFVHHTELQNFLIAPRSVRLHVTVDQRDRLAFDVFIFVFIYVIPGAVVFVCYSLTSSRLLTADESLRRQQSPGGAAPQRRRRRCMYNYSANEIVQVICAQMEVNKLQ